MWVSGCQATLQGTRSQFEDLCGIPARSIQGADRVPLQIPTAGDALRDPGNLRVVPASVQGVEKLTENALR
jgi:hypothetical protein